MLKDHSCIDMSRKLKDYSSDGKVKGLEDDVSRSHVLERVWLELIQEYQ